MPRVRGSSAPSRKKRRATFTAGSSLGKSLHLVGYRLTSTGEFGTARPWFERAVAEAEKGDVHGRVDHESLGKSLHQVA